MRVEVGGAARRRCGRRGTVEQLDAGRPLPARGCDGRGRDGGGHPVHPLAARADFSVDLLRLRSPAPVALPAADAAAARSSTPARSATARSKGVRVALDGPSWLVLGQSYSKGWRAECDGRDLGEPRPIDGYANGWRAPADCRDVDFTLRARRAPRGSATRSRRWCARCCSRSCSWALRRRAPRPAERAAAAAARARARRALPLPRAAAIALVLTVPLALLFAKRTSVVIFPLLTLILWRGVGARLLTAAAAVAARRGRAADLPDRVARSTAAATTSSTASRRSTPTGSPRARWCC